MVEPQLQSALTCPHCGHQTTETMPTDACQYFYDCKGCGALLKPLPGDCCVFCSYGSVPCPPVQVARRAEDGKGCCGSLSAQAPDDWVGNARTSLLAWWLPHTLVVAGLFAGVPARTAIWLAALVWMGTASILNARRIRTHPLPFHRALLSRNDRVRTGARVGRRDRRPLRLDSSRYAHSLGR
jgi:hypothetical protein